MQLKALREQAASGYQLRYLVTGSASSHGTPTQLNDTMRQEPNGEWERVDSWLRFEGGALDGQIRRVTGYSLGAAIIFAPAAAATVAAGASYALFKSFHPVQDLNMAINDAIRDLTQGGGVVVRSYATAAEVAPSGFPASYIVAVPSMAVQDARLIRVDRQMWPSSSNLSPIHDFKELFEGLDYERVWEDVGSGPQLKLFLRYFPVDGYMLRFHYERRFTSLAADTDDVEENLDAILYGARMHMAILEGDQAQQQIWSAKYREAKAGWENELEAISTNRPRIRVWPGP